MGRISPGPTRWPPGAEKRLVPAKSNLKPHQTFAHEVLARLQVASPELILLLVVETVRFHFFGYPDFCQPKSTFTSFGTFFIPLALVLLSCLRATCVEFLIGIVVRSFLYSSNRSDRSV